MMKKSFKMLVILQAISVFADKIVYLYAGYGMDAIDKMKDELSTHVACEIRCLNHEEVRRKKWVEDAYAFILPNGSEPAFEAAFSGHEAIFREYIENGGSFLGIESGARYACDSTIFYHNGKQTINQRKLQFYPGNVEGIVIG